jgi:nucleoside-diphosphate-sugar epimerase
MGHETIAALFAMECIDIVKVLVLPKEAKKAAKLSAKYGSRLKVVLGDIADYSVCQTVVADVQYVVNLAAVIPPLSDKHPDAAIRCNEIGTANIIRAIEALDVQPKLIHTSTVAVYGNRSSQHIYGRVGDPLLPSVYDVYALTKLRGEFALLESNIDNFVVLRQTAMLYNRMMSENISDGLMFHTCFNAPLEWITARDSARLVCAILEKDVAGLLGNEFWKKCFNIGGGDGSRVTGYDTFLYGFKLIGGTTEQFFSPKWNATRNFHGVWFYDSDILDQMFCYVSDTFSGYWAEIGKNHWYYSPAKVLPPRLVSKMVIQPLLKDDNAPAFWYKNGEIGKIIANFGSVENYLNLPNSWDDFPLLVKNKDEQGIDIDYTALRDKANAVLLSHGYDESKTVEQLTIDDLKQAAAFRGGELLSENYTTGDIYAKLKWRCHEGHEFTASVYTVIGCGHWCIQCFDGYSWNYDILAKSNTFFAQVWYDSHARDEDYLYWFDDNFFPQYKKLP